MWACSKKRSPERTAKGICRRVSSTWDQFAPLTSMGGLAEFPALIPGFPFLDGVVLYLQVLQIELTPTLALSTSNALRLKLGTK